MEVKSYNCDSANIIVTQTKGQPDYKKAWEEFEEFLKDYPFAKWCCEGTIRSVQEKANEILEKCK